MKKAGRLLVIAFFAVTGVLGFSNGMQEMGQAANGWQLSVQIADVAWGIFGVLVAIGLWRRRAWTFSMTLAWLAGATYAGATASWVFPPPSDRSLFGTMSAAVSMLVVGGLLAWYIRRATRVADSVPTPIQ